MPARLSLSQQFENHKKEWITCQRCAYSETRKKVCHIRGSIPCDILFVGEAPGESEDVRGIPFDGPAGELQNKIVANALQGAQFKLAYVNLVGCIPRDAPGVKASEPSEESITACAPRLRQLFNLCQPKLVVAVGKLAGDWLEPGMKHSLLPLKRDQLIKVIHPAAILRANEVSMGILAQRSEMTIRSAITRLKEEPC